MLIVSKCNITDLRYYRCSLKLQVDTEIYRELCVM